MFQGTYFLILPLVCLCSNVLDLYTQKAVVTSDYCPTIAGCQDATHVMCLYYDPNNTMGPTCAHAVNISVTPDDAQLIIDICNRIRSKIATGQGKGEDDSELPRGYGMTRLSWDPELATLAQVWANQCIMRLDPCRATKQFPKAGQAIGMIKFSVADWMPSAMTGPQVFNSTTVTPDKIRYAIISILKAWYEKKEEVTSDMISFLDVKAHIKNNQFIQLVSSRSTHMGCGLNGYRRYAYNTDNAALVLNVVVDFGMIHIGSDRLRYHVQDNVCRIIQVVCNFSYRPTIGESVYVTTPPTEPGYTMRCGCPLGFDEDEDCLCYETDREMPFDCKETGRCKPSVVVLPIFTVEDAPLNILKQNNMSGNVEKNAVSRHEGLKRTPFIDYTRSNKNNVRVIKQDSVYKTRRISTDVKNRYFGAKSKQTNKLKTKPPPREHTRRNIHKQSIFAKAAVFELPSNKIKQAVQNTTFKQDVKPRKDFSKVQKLVSKYLEERRIGHSIDQRKDNRNITYIKTVTIAPYNTPNKVYMKVHNLRGFTKNKFTYMDLNLTTTPSPKDDMKSLNEESDQIFMNLLDKLEEEVNNIDFNTKEKKFFDEKIRKIYGTLVKKPVVTEHSTAYRNKTLNKDIFDNNNIQNNVNRRNYWLDPNKHDEYTYRNLGDRPTNEKSMKKYYDKNDRDIVNNKYAKNYDRLSHRSEPLYNGNIEDRGLRNMYPRKNSQSNSMSKGSPRHENYYLNKDLDEYNSLESERRGHYYDKLNNLKRKVSMIKKHGRQRVKSESSQIYNNVNEDFHLRPVRPSKHGSVRRSRPKEMDLYMPNRARFVHEF